ncbi:GH1 family beta-glucosidase [Actinomadura opuntiae]|uniref:GH1 family beta-glucosidase n=1 Tax=Actinomadura sp. OS1-43 TaxID=604315 RepID=UPI00255A9E14|nr:GH1 family beta-glucosidase [Actinomadura sp. OS1-43]MDL4818499.1 GH1 family beta-glucosidase [Actinomadura sp. OS1-43]
MNELDALPADFTWGVATSAYQIEGAITEDGRSPSIWDTFSHTPGRIDGGDNGDVACDHYHRWQEDVEIMKRLGVDAYRFSIAWPRVVPDGRDTPNPAGLAFYDRLVDALLEAGITPYPTLYHWDLPQVLQDHGGWADRRTAEHFAAYAEYVAAALGDRVTHWATLNEPMCAAWIGHLEGRHAPGLTDTAVAVPASYHLLLGHGLATQAIRAVAAGSRVGIVNLLNPAEPASDSDADVHAARRFDGHANRWWLDPIHGLGFPQDMIEVYGVDLPEHPGDLETIATPTDWLGINYYNPTVVADAPDGPAPYTKLTGRPGTRQTMLGWEIRAEGLERTLLRATDDYGPGEVYVTENGSAWADAVGPDGQVADPERERYLREHLAACARAVVQGVPLAGYFAWSLLDNFEWAYGYEARFGLVHVDYATQKRTIKGSGHRYADIIRRHRNRNRRVA